MPRRIPKEIPSVSISDIATAVWAYTTRALEPNNPTTILTRIGDPTGHSLANLVAKLGNPALSIADMVIRSGFMTELPSAESEDTINVTDPTDTSPQIITVPAIAGASIQRAELYAVIKGVNGSANLQKVRVQVKGGAGAVPPSWTTFFDALEALGMVAMDGASDVMTAVQDISSLITAAGIYSFKCTITQGTAAAVTYTTEYVLVISWRF